MSADVWMIADSIAFQAENEQRQSSLIQGIAAGATRTMYIPIAEQPEDKLISRFLAKVAIEVLVHRLLNVSGWQSEIVGKPELEPLRRYARRGDKPNYWPFSKRVLYDENAPHTDDDQPYQVLHEFILLYTDEGLLFLVLAIFGTEFVLNIGEPELKSYERWLNAHNNVSPLYLNDTLPDWS